MADLFFPQLSSGAIAQYPIFKTRSVRTIKNVLADGSMITYPDPAGSFMTWQLNYTELTAEDTNVLSGHFNACAGRLHGFTFLDPTGNLLVSSSDLRQPSWTTSSLIELVPGAAAPDGTTAAFTATNTAANIQEITQTLSIPAGYIYCFSIYALSVNGDALQLICRGADAQSSTRASLSPQWTRITLSGALPDTSDSLTVAISLAAGQQVCLFGPQLEPQATASRYQSTGQQGGIYTNAHWAVDQLPITADGPDLFSTSFRIEAAL